MHTVVLLYFCPEDWLSQLEILQLFHPEASEGLKRRLNLQKGPWIRTLRKATDEKAEDCASVSQNRWQMLL